eukprot:TRINITY_DN826_c0_g2_i5.p1 TRINITY_DN826_c0_g2~~TRINITY_DN826_c0_g2_i5.p1  ORF type:complete len:289 (+),score=17.20 TRINITY_DN826_c0_g2_i5:140-1006(+)
MIPSGGSYSSTTRAGTVSSYKRNYLQRANSWNRKDILLTSQITRAPSRLRSRLHSAKNTDTRYNTMGICVSDTHGCSQPSQTTTLPKDLAAHPQDKSCDKCDGKHFTDCCPVYPKPRENHPDALMRKPVNMGRPCGNIVSRSGSVVRQPGDGSCLFHSLCDGMPAVGLNKQSAVSLRRTICTWIADHPSRPIAETPLASWILWDSNQTASAYARNMTYSGWGGGIEMAVFSIVFDTPVQVWERNKTGPGFRRISCFDPPSVRPDSNIPHKRCINVIYQGGVHYDALVL